MKHPTLLEGMVIALLLSLLVSPSSAVLQLFLGTFLVWKAVLGLITCLYIAYMLKRSERQRGRLTLAALACGTVCAGLLLGLQFGPMLLLCVALIWVIRSFAYSRSLASMLLHGMLCLLGCGAALSVVRQGGSPALALWSFFLLQAAFVYIPARLAHRTTARTCEAGGSGPEVFARAHQAAEHALRLLQRPVVR